MFGVARDDAWRLRVFAGVEMTVTDVDAVHAHPVWRDRADFIIGVRVDEGRAEQLWARELGDRMFEVCCIPFFAYDLALGDMVETNADHDVTRVVQQSGRSVFRAWFGDARSSPDEVVEALERHGHVIEWSSKNLLAIDAEDREAAERLEMQLAAFEKQGRLVYETGRMA